MESPAKRRKVEHVTGNWAFVAFLKVRKSQFTEAQTSRGVELLKKQFGKNKEVASPPNPKLGFHVTVSNHPKAAVKSQFLKPVIEFLSKELSDQKVFEFNILLEDKLQIFYDDEMTTAYGVSVIQGPNPAVRLQNDKLYDLEKLAKIVKKATKKFIGSSPEKLPDFRFHVSFCSCSLTSIIRNGDVLKPNTTASESSRECLESRPSGFHVRIKTLRLLTGDQIHRLPLIPSEEENDSSTSSADELLRVTE